MAGASRKMAIVMAAFVLVVLAIQLVPYGRVYDNPPVAAEPLWDSPQTRSLVRRACFGCHSNETIWPWYSRIAPSSWLVYYDVHKGRKELNFSDWKNGEKKHENMKDIRKMVEGGEMPPWRYRLMHTEARLSEAEKKEMLEGLAKVVPAERHPKFQKK